LLPLLSVSALAAPTINLIAPKSGFNSGSPVFYEASATSSCSKGIAAMRIYTAPGVNAFTVNGAHLETFIKLKPGNYNTVVQAWDNCGGVAKVPVPLTVSSTATVSVFLPRSGTALSPVHFAASAQSPSCARGITAMRIYTANGVTPYTVNSNQLDAYVQLAPKTYSATVQAWDSCGNVFKNSFQLTSNSDADAYLYNSSASGTIAQFDISSNGKLVNPNGSGNPPQFSSGSTAFSIAIDPGGWFAYVPNQASGIFGYQISRTNGALVPMQGSPFSQSGFGPAFMDPTGNFLYTIEAGLNGSDSIGVYRINRSSGALTFASSVTPGVILTALSTDPDGLYLYAGGNAANGATHIFAYKVNPNTGALNAVPGSPFPVTGAVGVIALSSAYQYLYAGLNTSTSQDLEGFEINYNSGALTPVPGNPYPATGAVNDPQSVLADSLARYLWIGSQTTDGSQHNFWQFDINGFTGSLGPATYIGTGGVYVDRLVEGHQDDYVFTAGGSCGPVTCVRDMVNSWTVNGSGLLQPLSGPFQTGTTNVTGLAIARQNPQ
jgi:6-phosphogluconolactonase (cycloisomerase 2 family)